MPAKVSVPDSLSLLLRRFRSCFTAPGYEVFIAISTFALFQDPKHLITESENERRDLSP